MRRFIIIAAILLFASTAFSQEAGTDYVGDFSDESRVILNEQLRKTSRRLRNIEDGISINNDTTGILTLDRGGTGQDFSSQAKGDMWYFDANGDLAIVPAGSDGQIIVYTSSVPAAVDKPDSYYTMACGSSGTDSSGSTGAWVNTNCAGASVVLDAGDYSTIFSLEAVKTSGSGGQASYRVMLDGSSDYVIYSENLTYTDGVTFDTYTRFGGDSVTITAGTYTMRVQIFGSTSPAARGVDIKNMQVTVFRIAD